MNYMSRQVVFPEVPDEISLAYMISGCSLRCPGCHSSDSWNAQQGLPLTREKYLEDLIKYDGWISCVLFMGGEWCPAELIECLQLAHERGLKTCLYTGSDQVPSEISKHLDYVKTGKYIQGLGGLDSPITNQKFIDLKTGRLLNHFFINSERASYDSTDREAATG